MAGTPTAESVEIATHVMLALTGRRWTWPKRQVVDLHWVPETVSTINLSGRPVREVVSVKNYYDDSDFVYELSDGFRLRIPILEQHAWPFYAYPSYDFNGGVYPSAWRRRRGTPVRVEYVYGSQPPATVQRAINQLALEFDLADQGMACALPERVTSVSREGVSWTVLDPQQFLEGGRTGLYYPDLVISMYGGKVKARARVFSVEHLPPRRLSSVAA